MERGAIGVLVYVYCRLRGHGRAGSRCACATRERFMQPARGIEQVLYALTALLEHKPHGEHGLDVLALASTRVASSFPTGLDLTSREEQTKRELRMKRCETTTFAADYSGESVRALEQGWTQTEWMEKQVGSEKVRKQAAGFGGGRIDWTPSSAKVRRERCDLRASGDRVVVRDDALHLYALDDDFQHSRDQGALDKLKNESDKGAWKQRSEALDTIQAICERAGCAIAFTCQVEDVVRLFKARLSDANANLKVKASNVLATVATSVGPDIAKMSKLLGPSLIAGVDDNKTAMKAAALHALHQWVRHSGKTSTMYVESLLVPLS
ncbi:hypothetical protein PsorP6_016202 [Peronosclerospora sorghi]|uniref:Uncharacterized protein n=1 Tax=Peronosclerospora sorghi TaxID=230839 RepID=A0ACC0VJS3_9STRA|nr:hypothetical protein PsorP6_016202 [Peronosclerospora sorghi]